MSAKFDSNKKKEIGRREALIWGGSIVLVVLAVIMVVLSSMGYLDPKPTGSNQTEPSRDTQTQTTPTLPQQSLEVEPVPTESVTMPTEPEQTAGSKDPDGEDPADKDPADKSPVVKPPVDDDPDGDGPAVSIPDGTLFSLGDGIFITGYVPYTGAFMEDRTDAEVTDVLGIRVLNNGETPVQTMTIALTAGQETAYFTLSTLLPGDTVIALERNRMSYSSAPKFTKAETSSVAIFPEMPTLCEDLVEIQCLNGIINVTNISGEKIPGDVCIYYKNCVDGIYYGGLTYRVRISGGMLADEIRQGAAAHFDPENSAVVFVTCE